MECFNYAHLLYSFIDLAGTLLLMTLFISGTVASVCFILRRFTR